MIIFPESLFPPIAASSEMKVELSARDPEQQSPHVTSDEPLSPPSLLPLAFDRSCRPVCRSVPARYPMSSRVCFLPEQHLSVASRRHRNYQVGDLVLSVHAECEKSLCFYVTCTLQWRFKCFSNCSSSSQCAKMLYAVWIERYIKRSQKSRFKRFTHYRNIL